MNLNRKQRTKMSKIKGGNKLNKVIFPYETIGNELLNKRELIDKLSEAKIEPIFFMREWDRFAFPIANKGFFPFKKKIPYLLDVNKLT